MQILESSLANKIGQREELNSEQVSCSCCFL